MAKRSEIEAQMAALQQQLDQAEPDEEVWVKHGDHEVKLTGKRAASVLKKFGTLFDDESGDEGDDESDDQGDDEDPKGGVTGYFRRKPAK